MRILIDPQIFEHQTRGGISRYVSELIKGLRNIPGIKVYCPILFSKNIYALENWKYLRIMNYILPFLPSKSIRWNRVLNNLYLRFFKIDVFFPSYYDTYFLNNLGNVKMVLTIYDMIHEKFHNDIEYSNKVIYNKKKLIDRANLIISISSNTREDILNIYPHINKNKIIVVYLGNSLSMSDNLTNVTNYKFKRNYFLFVGVRSSYKNFNWMINAISVSLTKYNIDLICVGGGDFSSEEMDTFARLGIKDSVFQLDVSDADLIGLYRDSLALIMPSLYEGFGFPIIEAMSNACPVILNENSCFPEIAGNAGCYYEADNVISFQLTVSKILNDQDYRNNVITLGLDNAKKFTWENCVLNTSEAILNLNS